MKEIKQLLGDWMIVTSSDYVDLGMVETGNKYIL